MKSLISGLILALTSLAAAGGSAAGTEPAAGKPVKIAWGITGSGHRLKESLEIMKGLKETYDVEISVFLSRAGEEAAKIYGFYDDLKAGFPGCSVEKSANSPFLAGALQTGRYDLLLIMPATSNTAAKISLGIADTLLTNAAAQAMKTEVPVYILPSDQETGEVVTDLPGKKKRALIMREVDLEAVEKLKKMRGITVLKEPGGIREILEKRGAREK